MAAQAGANKGQMYAGIGSAIGQGAMGLSKANSGGNDSYWNGYLDGAE
jgi:hypothetical protein